MSQPEPHCASYCQNNEQFMQREHEPICDLNCGCWRRHRSGEVLWSSKGSDSNSPGSLGWPCRTSLHWQSLTKSAS